MAIKNPVYMLEIGGGYNVYLTSNYQRIASYNKHESFDQFIKNTGINMIVYNQSLANDSRFKNDPQWSYFVKNYSVQGFTAQKIDGTRNVLLLHNSLLE